MDLTHVFDETTLVWPTEKPFRLIPGFSGTTDKGFYYASNRFFSPEHGGTHMDAPSHFFKGRRAVDQVPVGELVGPAAVVDVSSRCAGDPDYLVGLGDLEEWEKRHGRIPDGAILLLRTGYGRFWPDRARYFGTEKRGKEGTASLRFPGLDPAAARWLGRERRVKAVGLDTPSIDRGRSELFESHVALSERDIPALENLANLDLLPEKGAWLFALPMKIGGGTGAPLRAAAWVPR